MKCPLIDLLYCTLIVCLDSLDIRDCRTRGFQGPSWILSMLECSFGIFYTTSERAHGPHEEIKKKFQDFFLLHIWFGCPMPYCALCIILDVPEATWCLVWDSQWEGRNISACRSLSFRFIRSFCSVSE